MVETSVEGAMTSAETPEGEVGTTAEGHRVSV